MDLDPAELPQMPVEEALFVIAKRFVEFSCHRDAIRLELVYLGEARQLPEAATAFEHGGPQHSIAEVERYFKVMTKQKQLALDDARFAAAHFLNSIKGNPLVGGGYHLIVHDRPGVTVPTLLYPHLQYPNLRIFRQSFTPPFTSIRRFPMLSDSASRH
jgi:hypothetical protein